MSMFFRRYRQPPRLPSPAFPVPRQRQGRSRPRPAARTRHHLRSQRDLLIARRAARSGHHAQAHPRQRLGTAEPQAVLRGSL